jgi:hypothetical protein
MQGEYSDYDFAADQAEYANYAAAHPQQPSQHQQHPDSRGQYTASSHESYDDPYSAAELSGKLTYSPRALPHRILALPKLGVSRHCALHVTLGPLSVTLSRRLN